MQLLAQLTAAQHAPPPLNSRVVPPEGGMGKEVQLGLPYDDDDDEEILSDDLRDDDEDDEPTDERAHEQMLRAAGVGQTERKRQLSKSVVTEAFPESEFNVRGADGDGAGGSLTIHEMLESLGSGGAALGLKKRLSKLDKATAKPLSVPLAPAIQQRMERLAAYDATKEDITRWQPLVKANRELATLSFPSRRDNIPRKTSVQAVLSDFRPESELEMEVDALLAAAGVAGSTRQVEKVEALAMNTLDVEQVKERQARLSKMRALLFYHDEKAKRLKSIKSKSYRKHEASRLKMLAKKKGLTDADPDELEAESKKADFERAQERLKLTHRNTSRWARRLIKQGMANLPGTREAIAEQLRIGEALRKKAEATPHRERTGAGSDDEEEESSSSDEEGADPAAVAAERKRKLREAVSGLAAEGPLNGFPEDDKIAKLMKLPFMDRATRRRQAESQADALAFLDELDGDGADGSAAAGGSAGGRGTAAAAGAGRFSVGPGQQQAAAAAAAAAAASAAAGEWGSDEEINEDEWDDGEAAAERRLRSGSAEGPSKQPKPLALASQQPGDASASAKKNKKKDKKKDKKGAAAAAVGPAAADTVAPGGSAGDGSAAPSAAVANGNASGVTLAAAASHGNGNGKGAHAVARSGAPLRAKEAPSQAEKKRPRDPSAAKTPGERFSKKPAGLVDGVPRPLPAADAAAASAGAGAGADDDDNDAEEALLGGVSARQRNLIKAAFAGDDVEAEFAAMKEAEVTQGLPSVEVDKVLPGWGSWASEQKEPRYIREQRQQAEKLRKEAAEQRADARKPHVVISERVEKSADAYNVQSVPFPYTSREAFEGAMRMPLGRETNTDTAFRNLTRPKVLKRAGAMIDPIKYAKPVEKKPQQEGGGGANGSGGGGGRGGGKGGGRGGGADSNKKFEGPNKGRAGGGGGGGGGGRGGRGGAAFTQKK